MYIPSPKKDTLIYHFDVNSLYPSVMKENKFPTGPIREFIGDIKIIAPTHDSDLYWIARSKVSTIKDLDKPYLQTHFNKTGKSGDTRTIAANGNFYMYINSPEYYNSVLDYRFSIIDGYLFDGEDIFSEFITDLYTLRTTYPKWHPMNLISKLIMNSSL